MKKLVVLIAILAASFLCASNGDSQTSEFKTITISGTADVLIDSTFTTTYMDNRRLYINGIYAFYDNGANTNQIFVDIVSGRAALASGAGRVMHYSEAMTSSGVKGITIPVNITTPADSTVYFVISAASSDTLLLSVNYRVVGGK